MTWAEEYPITGKTGTNNVLNTTSLTDSTKKKTRLQPLDTKNKKINPSKRKKKISKKDDEVQKGERKSEIIIINK